MADSPRWLPAIALLVGLTACTPELTPAAFEHGTPEMRPEQFFAGITTSAGVLENRAGAPTHRVRVEGRGQLLPDGSFRLDQRVELGQDLPSERTWLLRRLDAHHYRGSLTDAAGPVEAEAYGNLFHLRYPISWAGVWMEQWLYLQPDGQSVVNVATVRWLGFVVARLSERITRENL